MSGRGVQQYFHGDVVQRKVSGAENIHTLSHTERAEFCDWLQNVSAHLAIDKNDLKAFGFSENYNEKEKNPAAICNKVCYDNCDVWTNYLSYIF